MNRSQLPQSWRSTAATQEAEKEGILAGLSGCGPDCNRFESRSLRSAWLRGWHIGTAAPGLPRNLQIYRNKHGWSQAEVARRLTVAGTRTTQGAVTHWETGIRVPRLKHLTALANVFGCTLDDLTKQQAPR